MVELPAIRVESLTGTDEARAAAKAIGDYDLICLTSPNGVKLLFEAIAEAGLDARALAGATVAAIGPGTARALAAQGIAADVIPERFVAEALVEVLEDVEVEGKRVLIARAAEARDVLPDALRERGAERRRRRPLRDGARGARREGDRRGPGRRLRHLHLLLDREEPHRRRSATASRRPRGSSRSAR